MIMNGLKQDKERRYLTKSKAQLLKENSKYRRVKSRFREQLGSLCRGTKSGFVSKNTKSYATFSNSGLEYDL